LLVQAGASAGAVDEIITLLSSVGMNHAEAHEFLAHPRRSHPCERWHDGLGTYLVFAAVDGIDSGYETDVLDEVRDFASSDPEIRELARYLWLKTANTRQLVGDDKNTKAVAVEIVRFLARRLRKRDRVRDATRTYYPSLRGDRIIDLIDRGHAARVLDLLERGDIDPASLDAHDLNIVWPPTEAPPATTDVAR
jgi:hypothetical protein